MLTVEYIKQNFGFFCQCFGSPRCAGRILGEIDATHNTPKILIYVVSEFHHYDDGKLSDYKFDFVSDKDDLIKLEGVPSLDDRASIWVFAEGRGFISFCQYQEDDSIYLDERPWGYFAVQYNPNDGKTVADIYSHCLEPGKYLLGYPMSSLCYIGLGTSKYGFGELLFAESRHERMVGTFPCSYHELSGYIHSDYDTFIKENKNQEIFVEFEGYVWPNTFFKNHEKTMSEHLSNEDYVTKVSAFLDEFYEKFIKGYFEHIENNSTPSVMSEFIRNKQKELDETTIGIIN